jgi:hypothetical protein
MQPCMDGLTFSTNWQSGSTNWQLETPSSRVVKSQTCLLTPRLNCVMLTARCADKMYLCLGCSEHFALLLWTERPYATSIFSWQLMSALWQVKGNGWKYIVQFFLLGRVGFRLKPIGIGMPMFHCYRNPASPMDVADRSSITRPAEFVRTKFGKLHILVSMLKFYFFLLAQQLQVGQQSMPKGKKRSESWGNLTTEGEELHVSFKHQRYFGIVGLYHSVDIRSFQKTNKNKQKREYRCTTISFWKHFSFKLCLNKT